MSRLKIGVIGCGAIGKDHIRRLHDLVPEADVVAVSDYFLESAEKVGAQYAAQVFETGEELIASENVQAVVVTSSDSSHAGYVKECLKYNKYVFCEKPLAETAAECEEIIMLEKAEGKRLVQVGFMRRYDPGYIEMKKIIDSGELGKPLMIHAAHRNFSQPPGFVTAMGVSNVAIHEIDICRWLLDDEYKHGLVVKVKQSVNSPEAQYHNPQLVLLQTESGATIDIEVQVSDAYGYDIQCQVVCENGTINLPEPDSVTVRQNAQIQYYILKDWKDRFITAYDVELNNWVKAVLNNNLTGPSSWDGYAACVAADALNASRGQNEFVPIKMIDKPELYD